MKPEQTNNLYDLMRSAFTAMNATVLFPHLVKIELLGARTKNPKPLNSSHEAYAVILEEVDEFWEEVKKKKSMRDPVKMRGELVQIAAMCQRAAEDLGLI